MYQLIRKHMLLCNQTMPISQEQLNSCEKKTKKTCVNCQTFNHLRVRSQLGRQTQQHVNKAASFTMCSAPFAH